MYALILAVFRCLDVSSSILVVIPEFGPFSKILVRVLENSIQWWNST